MQCVPDTLVPGVYYRERVYRHESAIYMNYHSGERLEQHRAKSVVLP